MSLAYVRTEDAPKLPAPASAAGLWPRLRDRFAPTPLSGVGTVIIALLLAWAFWSIFQWAVVSAVWTAVDREPCNAVTAGACWPFVQAKAMQWIYGFYPIEQRWRPNLVFLIGAVSLAGLLIPKIPYKGWNALFFFIAFPIITYVLLSGGILGLEQVDTEQWGGLLITLIASITGIVASLPLGILLALGRRSDMPVVRTLCTMFIEIVRGVPLVLVLFMAANMFPLFMPPGINPGKLLLALIGIGLFSAAYMAEVVRGGLQAIPKGQYEASMAVGLSFWRTMLLVLDDNNATNPTAIFKRLLNNAEFRILFADQVHRHFFNDGIFYVDQANPKYDPAFPERNPAAHMLMQMLQNIDTAIVCESARWGDVGPGRENTPHTRNVSFYDERNIVLGRTNTFGSHSSFTLTNRTAGLLAQFRTRGWYPTVVAPSFNQHGGRGAPGFNLTITAPAGTIYYTTNGADPRAYGSGAVAPSAAAYSGAISLAATTIVKARVLSGTNWSALNEATFTIAELASPLRITEINYNPEGGDAYEFIEVRNTGSQTIELGGSFLDGVTYVFAPGAGIDPGATLVLVNNANPAAFAARYPGVVVAGYYSGSLANGGERLSIKDATGRTILSVVYRDNGGWPTAADGGGSSLELIDPSGAGSDPANWQASSGNGSPGQPNPILAPSAVVLNEVAAENLSAVGNSGTFPDWIELKNTSASTVSLDGWSLSDDGNARKFVFPPGTTIAANNYLVVWCDATTNTTPGLHAGFALDREGDSVLLYNAQTQRVDAVSFGMQVANLTIGRIGGTWTLNTPTFCIMRSIRFLCSVKS